MKNHIKEVIVINNKIETDRVVNLLMGKKVEPRRDFITRESEKAKVFV